MKTFAAGLMVAGTMLVATPLAAQDAGEPGVRAAAPDLPEQTVFDGDYLTVGVGVAYGPSYSGSDDYTAFVLPLVQGSLGGVDISPRAAGIALDFIVCYRTAPARGFKTVANLNALDCLDAHQGGR